MTQNLEEKLQALLDREAIREAMYARKRQFCKLRHFDTKMPSKMLRRT